MASKNCRINPEVEMDSSQDDAIIDLFTEFEDRSFTQEQASLLCYVSPEMLQELVEDGLLEFADGEYRISHIPG